MTLSQSYYTEFTYEIRYVHTLIDIVPTFDFEGTGDSTGTRYRADYLSQGLEKKISLFFPYPALFLDGIF